MSGRFPGYRMWRRATGLALTAAACGVLLGGVSAWFLGAVAIAGLSAGTATTFNFFAPGALVRLFAVGRTVTRYGERLAGHQAALMDQVARRLGLFSAIAASPSVRSAAWQLGDQSRLADYLDDVEDIDYARLRATLPTVTLAVSITGCAVAAAFVAPLALLPISLLLLGVLLAGHWAATISAATWEQARRSQRDAAQRLGSAVASVVPLKAERNWDHACDDALSSYQKAEDAALQLRRSQFLVDALGSSIGPVSCLSVLAAAWFAGARGSDLLIPVFVGFAWLALGESTAGLSRIFVARMRQRTAAASIGRKPATKLDPLPGLAIENVPALCHTALVRQAPNGRPIGLPIPIRLKVGLPTVLTGASGSGKTSLLKQLAGWIGDDILQGGGADLSARSRFGASTLCLHDAAILDDTVRANLFAPTAQDSVLWEALAAVEMDARVALGGGLDAWVRQDMLSLGEAQRLNLARVWLSEKPMVFIDEPTEHLDEGQGDRVLRRLLTHLADRIVVISSHRALTDYRVDNLALQPDVTFNNGAASAIC